MSRDPTHCEVCEAQTEEGRRFCPPHYKRFQRGKRGAALTAPIQKPLPPEEDLHEAVLQFGEATEETSAGGDEAAEAAWRTVLAKARRIGKGSSAAIRAGLKRAREAGVKIGRPPKLVGEIEELARSLAAKVGISGAAEVLGVTRTTLRRALERSPGHKGNLSAQATERRTGHKGNVSAHGGR